MDLYQDWEPVVLTKNNPNRVSRGASKRDSVSKASQPSVVLQNQAGHKQFKQLDSDNPTPPSKISLSAAQQIQKARLANKLTQEALGKLINEKANVVKDYESGKVVPTRAVINKLNRALKVVIEI